MAFLAGMAPAASSFLDVPEPIGGLGSPVAGLGSGMADSVSASSSSSSFMPSSFTGVDASNMQMPSGMSFDASQNAFRVPVTQAQHDEIMHKVGHGTKSSFLFDHTVPGKPDLLLNTHTIPVLESGVFSGNAPAAGAAGAASAHAAHHSALHDNLHTLFRFAKTGFLLFGGLCSKMFGMGLIGYLAFQSMQAPKTQGYDGNFRTQNVKDILAKDALYEKKKREAERKAALARGETPPPEHCDMNACGAGGCGSGGCC